MTLKSVIYNFHPMWFSSAMGTGISSTILYNFPYPAQWLKVCSYIMFGISLLLFIFLNWVLVMAYFICPGKWKSMLFDSSKCVFLGCYSMAFSSIISYLHYITGHRWVTTIFTLWVINIAISLLSAWGIGFLLHWKAAVEPHRIHISLLLPVVTQNVVGALGGTIYNTLHPNLRLPNLILSYLCWSNGIALTFWVVGVYVWKLYIHKVPIQTNDGFAAFLPVGAFGQGAYGVLTITDNLCHYIQFEGPKLGLVGLSDLHTADANLVIGQAVKFFGLLLGLFLVSNGVYFTFNAFLSLAVSGIGNFTKAWWGCTFPLGTMAVANNALYNIYGFEAFRAVSAIYSCGSVFSTIICLVGSAVFEVPKEVADEKLA